MKKIERINIRQARERQTQLIKRKNSLKELQFDFEDEELEKFLQNGYSLTNPNDFYSWEHEALMLGRAINISAKINGISFKNHLTMNIEGLIKILKTTQLFLEKELSKKNNKYYYEIDLDFVKIAIEKAKLNNALENLNKFVLASLAA